MRRNCTGFYGKRVYPLAIVVITVFFPAIRCGDPGTASPASPGSKPVYKKPPSGFTDTLKITLPSAVFFSADSFQLQEIKKIMAAGEYESSVHDCYYQVRNSKKVLRELWPGIQVIEAAKARFILFLRKDQSSHCIDLDQQNDMCGLYLFKETASPEPADMTNIETALRFYFEKKKEE